VGTGGDHREVKSPGDKEQTIKDEFGINGDKGGGARLKGRTAKGVFLGAYLEQEGGPEAPIVEC